MAAELSPGSNVPTRINGVSIVAYLPSIPSGLTGPTYWYSEVFTLFFPNGVAFQLAISAYLCTGGQPCYAAQYDYDSIGAICTIDSAPLLGVGGALSGGRYWDLAVWWGGSTSQHWYYGIAYGNAAEGPFTIWQTGTLVSLQSILSSADQYSYVNAYADGTCSGTHVDQPFAAVESYDFSQSDWTTIGTIPFARAINYYTGTGSTNWPTMYWATGAVWIGSQSYNMMDLNGNYYDNYLGNNQAPSWVYVAGCLQGQPSACTTGSTGSYNKFSAGYSSSLGAYSSGSSTSLLWALPPAASWSFIYAQLSKSLTFSYVVTNPNGFDMYLGLGAYVRQTSNPSTIYIDPSHDTVVKASQCVSSCSRTFGLSGLSPGSYDVGAALWSGQPNQSPFVALWGINWQNDALTISSPTVTVSVSPTSGPPGTYVVISGSNFGSSDTSCAISSSPSGLISNPLCTLSAGAVSGSFTVGSGVSGPYTVTVTGGPTGDAGSASFVLSPVLSGQVTAYYDVSGASPGSTVSLNADVKNTGTVTFPAGVEVWFYVTDPSGTGKYVGYAPAAGSVPSDTKTYPYSWVISASAAPGSYSYKADIWLHSGSSYKQIASFLLPAKTFTMGGPSGQVAAYYDVTGASPGSTVVLKADVQNTGSGAFPSGVEVWFYVTDPSGAGKYIGYAGANGLAAGATQTYPYSWTVPGSIGSYSYKADLWLHSSASYKQITSFHLPARVFTVVPPNPPSGKVTSYYDVSGASPGSTVSLKADVQNTGTVVFPAGVQLWFYVINPSGVGSYVGYADASGLAVGSTQTYSYSWTVPASAVAGSSWSYKANLWLYSGGSYKLISDFLTPARAFTVGYTIQLMSYYDVSNAHPGGTVMLSVDVKNTGASALPSNAEVWFYVDGPGWTGSHWVGYASVAGLAAGATQTYSTSWTIPSSARVGTYTYWAQAWYSGPYRVESDWLQPGRTFNIT